MSENFSLPLRSMGLGKKPFFHCRGGKTTPVPNFSDLSRIRENSQASIAYSLYQPTSPVARRCKIFASLIGQSGYRGSDFITVI